MLAHYQFSNDSIRQSENIHTRLDLLFQNLLKTGIERSEYTDVTIKVQRQDLKTSILTNSQPAPFPGNGQS